VDLVPCFVRQGWQRLEPNFPIWGVLHSGWRDMPPFGGSPKAPCGLPPGCSQVQVHPPATAKRGALGNMGIPSESFEHKERPYREKEGIHSQRSRYLKTDPLLHGGKRGEGPFSLEV
jgi:hypothetical protein